MVFNPDGMNTLQLSPIFINDDNAFKFAFGADILADNAYCPNEDCDGILTLHNDSNQKYGCYVECPVCKLRRSILYGSFFTRTKLGLGQCLHLLYLWSQKYSPSDAVFETKLNKNTITNFYQCFRDGCLEYVQNCTEKIGGPGKTVEVDESVIIKRKHNVGAIRGNMTAWIFGGICREDGKRFIVEVENRKAETLYREILLNIDTNSTIITDAFRAYKILDENGVIHEIVNHSKNFVNPLNGANTQKVERMWRSAKEARKKYNGIPRNEIDGHLAEYIWRSNEEVTKRNAFRKALELMAKVRYY